METCGFQTRMCGAPLSELVTVELLLKQALVGAEPVGTGTPRFLISIGHLLFWVEFWRDCQNFSPQIFRPYWRIVSSVVCLHRDSPVPLTGGWEALKISQNHVSGPPQRQ